MTSKSYLTNVLGCAASLLLAVALAIAAIDPYGVTGGMWKSERPRAGRVDRDRLIKPIDIWQRQPATVVFGSSRIKRAINPDWLGANSYNSGIDNGTIHVQRAMFEFAVRHDKKLRIAIFELSYFHFFRRSEDPMAGLFREREWLGLLPKLFLSNDGLKLSLVTAAADGSSMPMALKANGWVWSSPPGHVGGPAFLAGFGKSWSEQVRPRYRMRDDRDYAELDKIFDLCSDYGVDCRFVLTPISGPWLACLRGDGEFPHFLKWRDRVSARGRVFDFSDGRYFEGINQPSVFWADTGHFTVPVGTQIAEAVMSGAGGERGDVEAALDIWMRANGFASSECSERAGRQ